MAELTPYDPVALQGPFAQVLMQPTFQMQQNPNIGSAGVAGQVAHLVGSFLDGAARGRMRQALKRENDRARNLTVLNTTYQNAFNNPDLTDDAKKQLTQQYLQLASRQMAGELQGYKEGKPAPGVDPVQHGLLGKVKQMAEGFLGGPLPKKVEPITQVDLLGDPNDPAKPGLLGVLNNPLSTKTGQRQVAFNTIQQRIGEIRKNAPDGEPYDRDILNDDGIKKSVYQFMQYGGEPGMLQAMIGQFDQRAGDAIGRWIQDSFRTQLAGVGQPHQAAPQTAPAAAPPPPVRGTSLAGVTPYSPVPSGIQPYADVTATLQNVSTAAAPQPAATAPPPVRQTAAAPAVNDPTLRRAFTHTVHQRLGLKPPQRMNARDMRTKQGLGQVWVYEGGEITDSAGNRLDGSRLELSTGAFPNQPNRTIELGAEQGTNRAVVYNTDTKEVTVLPVRLRNNSAETSAAILNRQQTLLAQQALNAYKSRSSRIWGSHSSWASNSANRVLAGKDWDAEVRKRYELDLKQSQDALQDLEQSWSSQGLLQPNSPYIGVLQAERAELWDKQAPLMPDQAKVVEAVKARQAFPDLVTMANTYQAGGKTLTNEDIITAMRQGKLPFMTTEQIAQQSAALRSAPPPQR